MKGDLFSGNTFGNELTANIIIDCEQRIFRLSILDQHIVQFIRLGQFYAVDGMIRRFRSQP